MLSASRTTTTTKMVSRRQPVWSPTDDMYEKIRQHNLRQLNFRRQLEEKMAKLKAKHDAGLAFAAAMHDAVRLEAEQFLRDEAERVKRLEEEERQRQLQIAEAARLEKLRAEEEQRRRQAEIEAEVARRHAAAEEEARRAQEEAAKRAVEEEQERARQLAAAQKAEAERIRREAEAVAAAQATTAAQVAEAKQGLFQPDPLHPAYVEVHRRLKQLRHDTVELTKDRRTDRNTPPDERQLRAKQLIGDVRREIRKCVGQFVVGKAKGANAAPTRNLMLVLRAAREDKLTPRVDIRHFIIEASMPSIPFSSPSQEQADPNMPAVFIYALNILSKAIVSQWSNEASVHPKKAEPVGIAAMHAFSAPEFSWGRRSLIDILISKLHKVCPVLFGIYGSEDTAEGRTLLGWARDGKNGPFVPAMRHHEIMTGLGAGYGAIAMRSFAKSKNENPYPNWKMWQTLGWMVNVRPEDLTSTHFVVLKSMLEGHCLRFLEFFGDLGRPALREITMEFPARANQKAKAAANAVTVLPDMWEKDLRVEVRGDPMEF